VPPFDGRFQREIKEVAMRASLDANTTNDFMLCCTRPCIIEELLGHIRVAAPPLGNDFPNPPAMGDKVAEVRSVICPSSMEASVVVHESTEA
jgi:hypothetical protein